MDYCAEMAHTNFEYNNQEAKGTDKKDNPAQQSLKERIKVVESLNSEIQIFPTQSKVIAWICIFMYAVGLFTPWNAILVSVSIYKQYYGDDVLVILSACYYIPALPIFIYQIINASKTSNSKLSFGIRNAISLIANAVVMFLLPSVNKKWILAVVSFLIGTFGAIGYGSFYQFISLLPPICSSIFAIGIFAPSFFLIVFQVITGYGIEFKGIHFLQEHYDIYFWVFCGILVLVSLGFYTVLLKNRYIEFYAYSKGKRSNIDNYNPIGTSKTSDILKNISPGIISIFLSIFASVTMTSLLAYVPSSNDYNFLPVVLTYVKTLSDLLGRILTLMPSIMKGRISIFVWGIIRFLALPVFLVYCFSDVFRSNTFIIIFVLISNVLSGYLNTSCYRWTAIVSHFNDKKKGAAFMNLSFQLSIYSSFIFQFILL